MTTNILPNPYKVHIETIECKFCKSENVVKNGLKNDIQYYLCKDCNHKFADNGSYIGMRKLKEAIGNGIQMFYDGIATNTIDEQLLNIYDVTVDSSNVWRWVQKYSKLACDYLYQYQANTGDAWAVDETVVKINGIPYWFWDVIDVDTRFLVGTHLSRTRTVGDAMVLFKKCKYRAKQKPKLIFSDRMGAYHKAINKVFWSRDAGTRTLHIEIAGLTTDSEKNIIERWHGSLKQRYKVMRGLKSLRSAKILLEGWSTVHYNFFKPHESIGDIPPALEVDLHLPFSNWVELIQIMEEARENPIRSNIPSWGDLEAL